MFLLEKESTCSDKTVENYKHDVGYFIDFIVDDRKKEIHEIDINSISLIDVKRYVVMLKKRPKLITHPIKPTVNKPITSTTIRTYSRHLKVFFNFLYNEEYMEQEIMKRFKLVKEEKKVIIPLTADEVETIDSLYNPKCLLGLRNLCIIHLMLDAGLRVSEVVRLRIKDVYFDKNLLFIRASKGNKERLITLAPKLKKLLFKYLVLYRSVTEEQIGDLTNYNEESLLL